MDNSGTYSDNAADCRVFGLLTVDRNEPEWPSLDWLRLGQADRDERRLFIGGSDANVILSGDAERILRLWREKRGEAEPEDLVGGPPGHARVLDRALQPPMVRAAVG